MSPSLSRMGFELFGRSHRRFEDFLEFPIILIASLFVKPSEEVFGVAVEFRLPLILVFLLIPVLEF